jgi:hypothetical protein
VPGRAQALHRALTLLRDSLRNVLQEVLLRVLLKGLPCAALREGRCSRGRRRARAQRAGGDAASSTTAVNIALSRLWPAGVGWMQVRSK